MRKARHHTYAASRCIQLARGVEPLVHVAVQMARHAADQHISVTGPLLGYPGNRPGVAERAM